ncbi:hypothetical protein M8J76_015069 [Diaphorina citri]|nr:hypothetical protein M8J75_006308 [Diaphorina citri]KAI5737615.1 hypothetical protein M8J76_015069 [Diaphorina citri]
MSISESDSSGQSRTRSQGNGAVDLSTPLSTLLNSFMALYTLSPASSRSSNVQNKQTLLSTIGHWHSTSASLWLPLHLGVVDNNFFFYFN